MNNNKNKPLSIFAGKVFIGCSIAWFIILAFAVNFPTSLDGTRGLFLSEIMLFMIGIANLAIGMFLFIKRPNFESIEKEILLDENIE